MDCDEFLHIKPAPNFSIYQLLEEFKTYFFRITRSTFFEESLSETEDREHIVNMAKATERKSVPRRTAKRNGSISNFLVSFADLCFPNTSVEMKSSDFLF